MLDLEKDEKTRERMRPAGTVPGSEAVPRTARDQVKPNVGVDNPTGKKAMIRQKAKVVVTLRVTSHRGITRSAMPILF